LKPGIFGVMSSRLYRKRRSGRNKRKPIGLQSQWYDLYDFLERLETYESRDPFGREHPPTRFESAY
jgi:hypothetical protein